ncbi:MAG: HU family DNA-binding protein [Alphaproteobacteria bacterium]|jgi:DNA-binding protein HU-beta|tara:strand:+ start:251 stop:523 length:273 start_codon:yes stop_codon:yes gene_type:complete
MNKNDLVSKVSDETGLSKSDSAKAVDSVIETITSELKSGGDVRLVGFGTFLVTKRKATTGRNPQTGAEIKIPAANVPKFRAGKSLKESLN